MKTIISVAFAVTVGLFIGPIGTENKNISKNVSVMDKQNNTYPVKLINVSISKPAEEVYRFASNPENFPQWIEFIKKIKKEGDSWTAETTLGNIRLKFVPKNEFGIIDHEVTLSNGQVVHNPMRVLPNNKGSEFIFTLFRVPGRTDKEFNDDASSVTKDVHKLKEIMERQ